MKYIHRNEDGVVSYDKYAAYLEEHRAQLSNVVDVELLRMERFVPPGRESLHDARLLSVVVDDEKKSIQLEFKGPYFDRGFVFTYEGVESAELGEPSPTDDILVHEVRLEGELLEHELHFHHDHHMRVVCRRIRFEERFTDPRVKEAPKNST